MMEKLQPGKGVTHPDPKMCGRARRSCRQDLRGSAVPKGAPGIHELSCLMKQRPSWPPHDLPNPPRTLQTHPDSPQNQAGHIHLIFGRQIGGHRVPPPATPQPPKPTKDSSNPTPGSPQNQVDQMHLIFEGQIISHSGPLSHPTTPEPLQTQSMYSACVKSKSRLP